MIKKYLPHLLILALSVLLIIFLEGFVIIFASLIVLFEKCIFGRINFIPGIEFTTLATILVTLKYGLIVGILFVIIIPLVIPTIINMILGERWLINPGFQFLGISFGNIVDIICVIIIFYLSSLDIIWIMLVVLIFKHTMNTLVEKLKGVTFSWSQVGIPISFLFNLSIIYFFHSFWVSLIV
jgi:hypothetical protein